MVTPGDFVEALEAEYGQQTGGSMPDDLRAELRRLILELHSQHPETYLAQGVQNAVRRAFEAALEQTAWSHEVIERQGWQVLRRFLRSERVRDLFADIQLNPQSIDAPGCLRQVIDNLERGSPAPKSAPAVPTKDTRAESAESARGVESPARPKQPLEPTVAAAAQEAGIDPSIAAARVQEQEALQVVLAQREMEQLPASVDAYLADGVVDAAQAEQLRALLSVDARERAGELDATEAEIERDLILTVAERRDLQARVTKAVEATVGYLQVFESLKKISETYDGLLKLLVDNKEMVTDTTAADRTPLLGALSTSDELLDLALDMVARTDSEVRLLAVRLPPYSKIVPRGQQAIANITVEPTFIDDLREQSAEELSEVFRAPDPVERARPAADIISLIHLIDQVVEPTAFRFKLRMLDANRTLQELQPRLGLLYQSEDPQEARRKAERILRQRFERRFADASTDEQQAARKRGEAVLLGLEQKVAADESGAAEQIEQALADEVVDDDGLTAAEMERGVQLARVEVRVAGRLKKIPTKIMPDPDDESQFVMAQRDPETGELAPQVRRGKKRYVARASDGTWKAA